MALATTTKLEAINSMLTAIGESPVNTITQATTTDVSIALSTLENVSREIQSQGWFFNTDLKLIKSGFCGAGIDSLFTVGKATKLVNV